MALVAGFSFEAAASNLKTAVAVADAEFDIVKCVLDTPDDTSDVILEVEGKELHANRAVLAHYSPVFEKMFFSDFKEKSEAKVPLPDKSHKEMAKFFNVLYPKGPTSPDLITDDDLVSLLTLADEYQAEQVKDRCQDYIGQQLSLFYTSERHAKYKQAVSIQQQRVRFSSFGSPEAQPLQSEPASSDWVNRLTLYLWMCDDHNLPRYRPDVMSVLLEQLGCLNDVCMGQHYNSLSLQSTVDVVELLCRKLDNSAPDLTLYIKLQQLKRQHQQQQPVVKKDAEVERPDSTTAL